MISAAQIEYIDVQQTYFNIETANAKISLFIFDDEGDIKVTMNHVITKPYAIDKAFDLFVEKRTEFSELYVSVDAIKVKQITDYMGEKIFKNLDGDISGWLFFFDPMPFANWDHPCRYLFLIDKSNYEEIEYNRGLDEKVLMEKIY